MEACVQEKSSASRHRGRWLQTLCCGALAGLHHDVGVLDLGPVGTGQLRLLLTAPGLLATLTVVHQLVGC